MSARIRPYHEGDNHPLIELERLCPQGKRIQIISHLRDYPAKAKQYDRSWILVAEDNGVPIGVVSAALKEMRCDQGICSAGYLFDLRVHPLRRRSGLGRALTEAIEKQLIAAGAEWVYLFAVGDNAPAVRLYQSLGYTHAATVIWYCWPLWGKKTPLPAGNVRKVCSEEIPSILNDVLANHNYLPTDWPALSRLPQHVGTFVAEDEKRKTLLNVWDGSAVLTWIPTHIPAPLHVLTKVMNIFAAWLPLPATPESGQPIHYRLLYGLFSAGTDSRGLLRSAVQTVNQLCRAEDCDLLLCPLLESDPLAKMLPAWHIFSTRALLMTKPLRGESGRANAPLFLDPRDF